MGISAGLRIFRSRLLCRWIQMTAIRPTTIQWTKNRQKERNGQLRITKVTTSKAKISPRMASPSGSRPTQVTSRRT